MDGFVKLLDENLKYISHEFIDDTIYIHIISTKKEVKCPYCEKSSNRVHSYYERSFEDLPIQDKKVVFIIKNRKMLCLNNNCSHKTFAESFDFLEFEAKKTNRLTEKIINISLNVSSINASQILKDGIVNVGRTTISRLLKKNGN